MYDTIHIWLSSELVPNIDLVCETAVHILVEKEVNNLKYEDSYITGYLDNFIVTLGARGISLKGSLSKYYYSDPLIILNIEDTKKAIERLSDQLKLPIHLADVRRIDIAQDIEMDYKAETYFKYLANANYYKRLQQPKSLYYKNGRREIVLYNKIAQLKADNIELPQNIQSKNILRLEYRLMKKVRKQLLQEVKAYHLYDNNFYRRLLGCWYEQYQSINKVKPPPIDLKSITNIKRFIELSALAYWENEFGGLPSTLDIVDELKESKCFKHRENYSRLKAKIKNIYRLSSKNEDCSLLDELNQKVETTYKRRLSEL